MVQVEALRDDALRSRPTKTLASSRELGAIAKRSRMSWSQSSKNRKGPFLTFAPPDSPWVGGYQRWMPENFRNSVNRLRVQVSEDGSVGLREKPVVMDLEGLPPFTATLANTAAVITTNCVKSVFPTWLLCLFHS